MKKPVLFLIALCFCIAASAQKVYYMYFQSENQSPFYIKMGDKTYSSASTGYLIISNLQDSTYNFTIGFPSSSIPETKYTVAINGNDKGLILKNSDAGPSLFDLQTQSVVKSDIDSAKSTVAYETKTDRFSTSLSKVAEDPTLLQVPIQIKKDEKKNEQKDVVNTKMEDQKQPDQLIVKDSTQSTPSPVDNSQKQDVAKQTKKKKKKEKKVTEEPVKTDDGIKTTDQNTADTKQADQKTGDTNDATSKDQSKPVETSSELQGEFKRSVVARHAETSTTEGFTLIYFDIKDGAVDTIRLLIPNPKVALKHADDEMTITEIPADSKQDVVQQDNTSKKKKKKNAPVEDAPKQDAAKDEIKQDTPKQDPIVQNSDSSSKVTETPAEVKQDVVQDNSSKKKKKKSKEDPSKQDQTANDTKQEVAKQESPKQDVQEVTKNDATNVSPKTSTVPTTSECSAIAPDKDFFKLRKIMAGKTTDEDMVEEAKKYFKKECFTTEQIRYLSSLFLTSAGKYIFFDASFTHVSDQENYKSLQSEIKEEYYLKRFKALVGE